MKSHLHVSFFFLALCSQLACATEFAAGTNVGGWQVTLVVASNRFTMDTPITAELVISNTTAKVGDFGRYNAMWGDAPTVPNFGALDVKDISGGIARECQFRIASAKGSRLPPVVGGKDLAGEVTPSRELRFDFDLSRFWGVTNAGVYEICFRGTLPTIAQPEIKVDFQTEPLVFTIESARKKE